MLFDMTRRNRLETSDEMSLKHSLIWQEEIDLKCLMKWAWNA